MPRCAARAIAVAGALVALGGALGCADQPPARGPSDTLRDYAAALRDGRTRDAYALLSDETKKTIPFEAFRRMVEENPKEVDDIAGALARPTGPPLVTATVTAPSGETLRLVYENDRWRVDGSAVDLYSQETPESAVRAFVRAFENERYDVLLRFVPEAEREGLDAEQLKKSWEGEQREEMERLVQALKAALPTARIERLGERATMAYGAGGTVELLRENGVWRIEDFQ